jgi:hypothetical protein
MNEELPKDLEPPELNQQEKDFVEEEIVSPVQPPKPKFTVHMVSTVIVALVAVGAITYLAVVGRSALPFSAKVANAPEEDLANGLQMPTHITTPAADSSVPTVVENPYQPPLVQPPAVIDETPPAPRISSTFTNEPSIATQPTTSGKVAGAHTTTPSFVYTSTSGFSLRVPAGGKVQEVEQGRVIVLSAKGQMLSEITILPNTNSDIDGVPAELALSSNVSDIKSGVFGQDAAYFYTVNGTAKSARIVRGMNAYYMTDYAGTILSTFSLR